MDFDPCMDDYDSDYLDFDLCMDDDELVVMGRSRLREAMKQLNQMGHIVSRLRINPTPVSTVTPSGHLQVLI